MTRARLHGLYFVLAGSVVFILLGLALESNAKVPMQDFAVVYDPAQCLLQHSDPYNESEVSRIYRAETNDGSSVAAKKHQAETRYIYFPTSFILTVPFAMLPWGPAHTLWMILTLGCLVFASFLIWDTGAIRAPIVSGVLIGFFLANSEVIVVLCNSAAIAISLCAVAVWCFLRERFVRAGILCLAISLAVKPQDAGLVWLYFLLAGGVYRKRALQTLLALVVLCLPAVLWVWLVSPHWIQEWHSNVLAYSTHGGINDPASSRVQGRAGVISLQAVVSAFRDDPRIYDPVTYALCAAPLCVWAFVALRSRSSPTSAWLAIAVIAPLSMLPVSHHLYDTKLLLLTIPACAMLWASGGTIGWLALLVNSAGFVLVGDLPWAMVIGFIGRLHVPTTVLSSQMRTDVQVFSTPLILLAMGVFYLWVYARHTFPNNGSHMVQTIAAQSASVERLE